MRQLIGDRHTSNTSPSTSILVDRGTALYVTLSGGVLGRSGPHSEDISTCHSFNRSSEKWLLSSCYRAGRTVFDLNGSSLFLSTGIAQSFEIPM